MKEMRANVLGLNQELLSVGTSFHFNVVGANNTTPSMFFSFPLACEQKAIRP